MTLYRRIVEWVECGRERAVQVFTREDLCRLVASLESKHIPYLVRFDS